MSGDLHETEEQHDDVPAALAPFAFMSTEHVEQARNFLKHRTSASVVDFDVYNGFIYMRWPEHRSVEVFPWDIRSLERLSETECAAVADVWEQMVDDLRMCVERGEALVVAQQSRTGPLCLIPPRIWWLYRVDDWEAGVTNDSGSGDRLFGVSFRPSAVADRSSAAPRSRTSQVEPAARVGRPKTEVAKLISILPGLYPEGDPVRAGKSVEEVRETCKIPMGKLVSKSSLSRARKSVWPIQNSSDSA